MAEVASSAVAQEVISQVLSGLKAKYKESRESNAEEHVERMEMALIKLEAALETSDRWNITSAPLLRWRSKLKRAAQECDDVLRSCKQRLLQQAKEEADMEHHQVVRTRSSSSFPNRILHSAGSLLSSVFNRSNREPNGSTVRRFEWFAEGAGEFLRHMELGGAPRRYMFFHPLVRHLLQGKGTKYYCLVHRDHDQQQHLSFFLRPFSVPGYGMEGRLILLLQDGNAPENDFVLGLHMRLTESTDIVGVVVRCMHLFMPHLRSTAEAVKTQLTKLPSQDFYWVPYDSSISSRKDHWDNLHTILCNWFRPNPMCCQQQQSDHPQDTKTTASTESLLSDTYLQPVTQVYLQGYVSSPSACHKRQKANDGERCPSRDSSSYLKLSGLFSPHDYTSSDDWSPAVRGSSSSAKEMINNNGEISRGGLYANISFEQLGEIILPNAVDYLRGNAAATSYQMLWKSKHGSAYFRVEETPATNRKGSVIRQELRGKKVQGWTSDIAEFIGSFVAHAPVQLQGSISDWVQKEKADPTTIAEV